MTRCWLRILQGLCAAPPRHRATCAHQKRALGPLFPGESTIAPELPVCNGPLLPADSPAEETILGITPLGYKRLPNEVPYTTTNFRPPSAGRLPPLDRRTGKDSRNLPWLVVVEKLSGVRVPPVRFGPAAVQRARGHNSRNFREPATCRQSTKCYRCLSNTPRTCYSPVVPVGVASSSKDIGRGEDSRNFFSATWLFVSAGRPTNPAVPPRRG